MSTIDPRNGGLQDRIDTLAEAGAEGIDLARPDALATSPRWRGRAGLALATAALLAVAGTAIWLTVGGDDERDHVRTDPAAPPAGPAPSWDSEVGAVVAVVYAEGVLEPGTGVAVRFVDPTGRVLAQHDLGGGTDQAGILQVVPAGVQDLVVTHTAGDATEECTQQFAAQPYDQLILRVQPPEVGMDGECAPPETVADWAADATGPTGQAYVGLTPAEAQAQAEAAGLTTRVVGLDGADLIVTDDLRTDRLNLMVFADVVVAARLDTE